MRRYNYQLKFFVMIFISSLLTACAKRAVVPVTRPAEINLRGIDKVVVADIEGNMGSGIADLLTTRLFESGKYEVVDRENLDKIMAEHKLSYSGILDPDTAAEMGKIMGASALVTGKAVANYKANRWHQDYKDKENRIHRVFYVKGNATVTSTLKVIGLNTGKVLAVKTLTEKNEMTHRAEGGWPVEPDRSDVISPAAYRIVNRFMKAIAPYTEYVAVDFMNSKLPESESGIKFAQTGQWDMALEQFKTAKDKNPTDPACWYNLGLAYEYTDDYDQAIDAFNESNKLKPSDKCVSQIANVKRLRAERAKLEAQGVLEH